MRCIVVVILVDHRLLICRVNIYAEEWRKGSSRSERRTELRVGGDACCECARVSCVDVHVHLVEPCALLCCIEHAVLVVYADCETLVVRTVIVTADDTFLSVVTS